MIGFLQGTVVQIVEDTIILNVRGVGYEVTVSTNTLAAVERREVVQLWIHTQVREDAFQLFGFSSQTEKQLFLSLIKVSGVGPKMAVKILSGASVPQLIDMIDNGDVKGLTQLPKVGKKTAEQMILSLGGKLVREEAAGSAGGFVARGEIVSALVNLGFRLNDVEQVVSQMESSTDLQDGVRKGLMALTSQV